MLCRLLAALAFRDVMFDADGIKEFSVGIADARRGDGGPEVAARLGLDPLLDRVAVDLAGDLAAELRAIGVRIRLMAFREDHLAEQFFRGVAHQIGKPRIDAQQTALGVDLDHADAGMFEGLGEALLLVKGRIGAARRRGLMKAANRADAIAGIVFYGFDVKGHPDEASIRLLEFAFEAAQASAGPQHGRHRQLVAGGQTVADIGFEGYAEAVTVFADPRRAAP